MSVGDSGAVCTGILHIPGEVSPRLRIVSRRGDGPPCPRGIAVTFGRTYAAGLTKFEPTDMERLLVPDLPALNERESPTER